MENGGSNTGEARAERLARTESLFREVNERIVEHVHRFDSGTGDFVCECGDPACVHRIEVPVEEYERVREDPERFVVAPGHEDAAVEATVRDRGGFRIVRKTAPLAVAVVRRLDPRSA